MFGIGWPELLLIGIVALVAIGPKDLPPLMNQLGKWTRRARAMMGEFQKHWDDLPNQVGLDEMQKQADELQRKSFEAFKVDPATGLPPYGHKPEDFPADVKTDKKTETGGEGGHG